VLRRNGERRRDACTERFLAALASLGTSPDHFNLTTVCEVANVSRSWPYRNPEARRAYEVAKARHVLGGTLSE
jgi:hypothetical protein